MRRILSLLLLVGAVTFLGGDLRPVFADDPVGPTNFEQYMKKEMEPLGIMARPYPFHDGVKPPDK